MINKNTSETPIIFENVTKQYRKFTAVQNVSFRIERGQFFGLLGPNGAGKSTIVKMIMGFLFPTKGSISIFGIPSSHTKARGRIGFLSENHTIPPDLTGYECLKRHCELLSLPSKDTKKEIERVLCLTKMNDKGLLKAGTYSKGMLQRIGLASAMLSSPDILVLDEPTNGLDPIGIRDFRLILDDLRKKNITVFINSHLLSEIEKTCDVFAIIRNGEIVKSGNMTEISLPGETLEDSFIRYVENAND